MWGRRKKRGAQLPKQLALGLLEDAMGRVSSSGPAQQEDGQHSRRTASAPHAGSRGHAAEARARRRPYPGAAVPSQAALPARSGLEPTGVPVDTSAGPAADDAMSSAPRPRGAERTGKSTRHGSLG